MAFSVEDLEWEIFLASGLRAEGKLTLVVGVDDRSEDIKSVCGFAVSGLLGDVSLLRLIDRTACCNSPHVESNSLDRGLRPPLSSPSEFSDESGGDMMAPVGINKSFNGGGDWRMLPLGCSESAGLGSSDE